MKQKKAQTKASNSIPRLFYTNQHGFSFSVTLDTTLLITHKDGKFCIIHPNKLDMSMTVYRDMIGLDKYTIDNVVDSLKLGGTVLASNFQFRLVLRGGSIKSDVWVSRHMQNSDSYARLAIERFSTTNDIFQYSEEDYLKDVEATKLWEQQNPSLTHAQKLRHDELLKIFNKNLDGNENGDPVEYFIESKGERITDSDLRKLWEKFYHQNTGLQAP